jgi:Ni/Co efflux regulator RcnB
MNRKALLAAAACLLLPASALADPPSDQNPSHGKKDQGRQQAKGPEKGNRPAHGEGRVQGPAARAPAAGAPFVPRAPTFQHPPTVQRAPPGAVTRGPAPPVQTIPRQETRRSGPQPAPNRGVVRQAPAGPAALGGWRAPPRGPARDQAGQQWRQSHQGLDNSAPWRRSRDWWRNDSGFRLFQGPRIGFFFVPELGYIVLPHQYRSRHWQAGDYLPDWFRRYAVRDYWRYGLPQPPPGCIWVWLNGDVALIDRSDGYILDVIRNVW